MSPTAEEKSGSSAGRGAQVMKASRTVSMAPRIVKFGKVKKSQVKKLKNGHGKLLGEIRQSVSSELSKLPDPGAGKAYQPVVVVFRRRRSSRRSKKMKIFGASIDPKKLRKSGIRL